MTALERAEAIAGDVADEWVPSEKRPEYRRRLTSLIHSHIIEHSNDELYRRRMLEARVSKAAAIIRTLENGVLLRGKDWGGGETARLAEAALKALEADR